MVFILEYILECLPLLIVAAIIYFLVKKGHARIVLTRTDWFRYFKTTKSIRCSYRYFSGIKDYDFLLKKGRPVTMQYEAKIEKGKLIIMLLKFASPEKNALERIVLDSDTVGEVTITPPSSVLYVRLEGIKTKGGCNIKFTYE